MEAGRIEFIVMKVFHDFTGGYFLASASYLWWEKESKSKKILFFLQAVAGVASLYYRGQTILGRRCQSEARIHLALELLEPEVYT